METHSFCVDFNKLGGRRKLDSCYDLIFLGNWGFVPIQRPHSQKHQSSWNDFKVEMDLYGAQTENGNTSYQGCFHLSSAIICLALQSSAQQSRNTSWASEAVFPDTIIFKWDCLERKTQVASFPRPDCKTTVTKTWNGWTTNQRFSVKVLGWTVQNLKQMKIQLQIPEMYMACQTFCSLFCRLCSFS